MQKYWYEFLSQCKILLEKIVLCVSKDILTSILVYCHQIICNLGHFGVSISVITLIFVVNINIKKMTQFPPKNGEKIGFLEKVHFQQIFILF